MLLLFWIAIIAILAHSVLHADELDNHTECPLCKFFGGLSPIPECASLLVSITYLLLYKLIFLDSLIPILTDSGFKSTRSPPLPA